MSEQERLDYLAANPDSFLHVTRTPRDPDGDRTPEDLAGQNHTELERLRAIGAFESHPPALYLYRIDTGEHSQTALIADVALSAFDQNMIRPHERTLTDREDQLALHLRAVGAVANPVAMTHHHIPGLSELLDPVTKIDPLRDFVGNCGLHQLVWRIPDAVAAKVIGLYEGHVLYIADGHHRLAAALRFRDEIDRTHPGALGPQHSVLTAIYPDDQVQTVANHRIVETEMSTDDLIGQLKLVADLEPVDALDQAIPTKQGCFGLYYRGNAWRFQARDMGDDLDVVWLQDQVLGPVLDIHSPRTDPRLSHVPDTVSTPNVAARSDAKKAATFLMVATSVDSIMESADRRTVLPPKSSFFTPKPRSGIFLVSREPVL